MTYSELRRSMVKAGDTVWAYEFELNHTKESPYLSCKPTKGRVMCGNTQSKHDELFKLRYDRQMEIPLQYFVPYKKDGVHLAWSKAVGLSSRHYALTEEMCIALYNKSIDSAVDWFRQRADECEALKVISN